MLLDDDTSQFLGHTISGELNCLTVKRDKEIIRQIEGETEREKDRASDRDAKRHRMTQSDKE